MLLLDDDDELPLVADAAELAAATLLGVDGIARIDRHIVSSTRARAHKVARVVSEALKLGGFDPWEDGVVELHVRRVIALAQQNRLLIEGNSRRPRFSEVRLAEPARE